MTGDLTVELHLAYRWDCDDCGGENFERARTLTREEALNEVDPEALAEFSGSDGVFLTSPDEVVCRHCQRGYAVRKG